MSFAMRLNKRVTIRGRVGADALGQPSQNWIDLHELWASVRFASGLEAVKANAEAVISKASIRIRYRTDITETMRVVYSGVEFEIRSVLPDEVMRQHVDLVCEMVK